MPLWFMRRRPSVTETDASGRPLGLSSHPLDTRFAARRLPCAEGRSSSIRANDPTITTGAAGSQLMEKLGRP
jgi:hypothetical protein